MISPTKDIIEDIRQGRMVILVDEEDRETKVTWYSRRNSPRQSISTSWPSMVAA